MCVCVCVHGPGIPSEIEGGGDGGVVIEQFPSHQGGQQSLLQFPGILTGTLHPGDNDFIGKVGEEETDGGGFLAALCQSIPLPENRVVPGRGGIVQLFLR